MILENFKPNLVPNFNKKKPIDIDVPIQKNGGYDNYIITGKKDGCRLELLNGKVLTRSMKAPGSRLVVERFQPLADLCKELNIIIEGEFYMHRLSFNNIFRFFAKSDVTTEKYRIELEKKQNKDLVKFDKDYDKLGVDFLTTFHDDLKFWLFDGIVIDRPDLKGYAERMYEIVKRLQTYTNEVEHLMFPTFHKARDRKSLGMMFEMALDDKWEGLVLTHKDHEYKFGRNSINQGTLLKLKDDSREYDGIVLDVEEGTQAKEGAEKSTNELGRSVTSQKKDDREPNGMAKGFTVQYEDVGTFTVSLRGFDNEAKKELLRNKESYIGRHFKYSGMPPVKDFPRSVHFDCWRDEK